MTTTPEMLAALRAWLAEQAPGLVPASLTVTFHNHPSPLQLPLAAAAATPPLAAEASSDQAEHQGRYYRCMEDILAVLEQHGAPLTGLRLKSKLAAAGKEWSDRWVDEMLARLVKDGSLDNPPEGRPRGYRLPEWDRDSARRGTP